MLYDGSCPVCVREVEFLSRRRRAARVRFMNIFEPSFSPAPYGKSVEQLARELHVFCGAENTLYSRVPAFRVLYRELFGVDFLRFTAFWPLSVFADSTYTFVAAHKHRLAWLFERGVR
jgi:predicted DCC family thiol-disulfide oxidoreductase YuxK